MKARSLFVWENAGKCMQKAEKRQPTVNITGTNFTLYCC